MSRDWKPIELFYADEHFENKLRDSPIIMTDHLGNQTRLDNYQSKDRYPELSFFLDGFDELYLKYKDSGKACVVLDEIDSCIKEIEDSILSGRTLEVKESFIVVERWFRGELDSDFYYNHRNNELFVDWIEDSIADKIRDKEKQVER